MPYMAPNIRPLPVPAKIQRAPNHSSEEHYIYIYTYCVKRGCVKRGRARICMHIYIYICICLVCMCTCIYACFESGKPFEKKPRSYKAVV